MKQIASLGTSALLAAALWATPASQPGAQSLLHVSGGYRTAPQHGHRRRHHQGPTYSHGVPFMKRRDAGGTHVQGQRGRHVISPGCRPVTLRSYDRRGHLVLRHTSICNDRFGRPYYPTGHGRRH